MDFQGHTAWTPLKDGNGDLGTTYRSVDLSEIDTEYYGHGGGQSGNDSLSPLSGDQDGYDMKDLRG